MDGYRNEVHSAHVRSTYVDAEGKAAHNPPPPGSKRDKTPSWSTDAALRRAVTLQAEEPGPREAPPALPTACHGGRFHIHLESL